MKKFKFQSARAKAQRVAMMELRKANGNWRLAVGRLHTAFRKTVNDAPQLASVFVLAAAQIQKWRVEAVKRAHRNPLSKRWAHKIAAYSLKEAERRGYIR